MKYKFRAYNKETEKMILLDPLQWPLKVLDEEKNWKIMMFTGLLDRHGKEIYEGDIVSVTNLPCQIQKAQLIGVVEFSWAAFALKIKRTIEWKLYNVDSPEFMLLSSIIGVKEMAVIGNRWENLELLEENG